MWQVTTFDARKIEYGVMWPRWTDGESLVPGELTAFSPYVKPFTCRVEPGDAVVWAGWCRVSGTLGTPQILPLLRWYSSAGTLFHVSQGTLSNLTTTRTEYIMNATAPSGVHYLRASFAFAGTGAPYTVTVVDSARLGIS